jgi:hypothetical protein
MSPPPPPPVHRSAPPGCPFLKSSLSTLNQHRNPDVLSPHGIPDLSSPLRFLTFIVSIANRSSCTARAPLDAFRIRTTPARSRLGTRENTRQQQREAMAACKCLPGWPNEHEAIRETAHRRRPLTAQKMKPMVTNDPGGHIPPRGKHAQATKKRAGKNCLSTHRTTL